MAGNDSPVKMPELQSIPESERGVVLDEGMKQVLSVLAAYWQEKRVSLKASPGGILFTSSPPIGDIFHVTADQENYLYQGGDIQCSEVMVMGHPDNSDLVWARTKTAATNANAWPLAANTVVGFSVVNLSQLRLRIIDNGEIAIVAYTI